MWDEWTIDARKMEVSLRELSKSLKKMTGHVMPFSAKRICKCGAVVRGKCQVCSGRYDESRNQTEHRQYAVKIYGGRAFRQLRKEVYVRGAAECAGCGLPVAWADYHCDHIKPIEQCPELALDAGNLQVMHRWCHSRKTAREGSRKARGVGK